MNAPRISLIHATPLAMPAIKEAFARLWPAARCMNMLDDSLSPDLVKAGGVDAALAQRFVSLVGYARQAGADAVLFTCSAFGPAIEAAARTTAMPALKPNEAMFEEALDLCAAQGGTGRIGLVSTFAASVPGMRDELLAAAAGRGLGVGLAVQCAEGAMDAMECGDAAAHDRLVSEAAGRLSACDVLMLGQFSMAHLRGRIAAETSLPVLSSPDSAVRMLQKALSSGCAR